MTASPPSILLVEDDPDDVALFTRALTKLLPESRLSVARDGEEAIEILSRVGTPGAPEGWAAPSYVFLDVKLPKKSGLEVLEWIRHRAELRDLRLVVLTSSEEPQDLARAGRADPDQYCVKPPNHSELVDILRAILRKWRLIG